MSSPGSPFSLVTERLLLRQMSSADLPFVTYMLGHPEIMRFYPKTQQKPEEVAAAWIERQVVRYEKWGYGLWLVELKESGEPVGQVGLTIQIVDGVDETEVGYLIDNRHWRKNFAFEAASACRDYAFDALNCPYVISLVHPVNMPSRGVARKMGMTEWKRADHANLEHIVFRIDNHF